VIKQGGLYLCPAVNYNVFSVFHAKGFAMLRSRQCGVVYYTRLLAEMLCISMIALIPGITNRQLSGACFSVCYTYCASLGIRHWQDSFADAFIKALKEA
jgi:hypothetical protein